MPIEFQASASLLTNFAMGIAALVALAAVALFVFLKRCGHNVLAVAAPLVGLLLCAGALGHEAQKAYSLKVVGPSLVYDTPVGTRATACERIEFMIKRGRGGCTVTAFRGDERLFQSAEVERARCQGLEEQLRQLPCKASDRLLAE